MSKLRDRIRNAALRRRGGLGFAPAPDAAGGGHVLVLAEVTDAAGARSAAEAGAAALLYAGDHSAVGAVVEAATGLPVGCRLEAATGQQAATVADADADFFVFDDGRASAEALLERRLGCVLLLDREPDEERLRMLATLDLDAVLIPGPLSTPTVRDQIRLRRIFELARAPLVIPADGAVPASTLEVWRDAGAPAVLVPGDRLDTLAAVIQAASEVPPPRPRREERPDPLLPAIGAAAGDDDDDFDDFD